ncbi:hypothetical protein [uncultured Gammaproteobacteria bacterium]|nr:hypothetical protein [uncultured Gammaproteobacteria bacterium]
MQLCHLGLIKIKRFALRSRKGKDFPPYPNTAYLREIPYELMASRALLRGFLSSG